MSFKIVSDSSANPFHLEGISHASVPLKILSGGKEYVDNEGLDVARMVAELKASKTKSGTSCPNIHDWLESFRGADEVMAVTISQKLSGSFSAALNAAEEYIEDHPGKKVFVLDSQTAGPEMVMLMEKIRELVQEGLPFQKVKQRVMEYHSRLHTLFCLESLSNLAKNGRVNQTVATIAGVLGIRVVGAAKYGEIIPAQKPRGQKKALEVLQKMMEERGLVDRMKVRIAHCFNLEAASQLKERILAKFPNCQVTVEPTGGLCSFYAEAGGLIIGMEGNVNLYKY